MKSNYWIERWKNSDSPWHLAEPEPLLLRHFPQRQAQNVLVPLCGKSVDLLWLKEQGHKVFGIELSELACRSFFEESKIEYKTSSLDSFQVYESEHIKIWCGDFFELQIDELPQLDLIYDRAALIALPADLRKRYAQRIKEIAKARGSKNFEMLVILREGIEPTHEGPPFHISADELRSTYDSCFNLKVLETMSRPSKNDPALKVVDTAHRLSSKQ